MDSWYVADILSNDYKHGILYMITAMPPDVMAHIQTTEPHFYNILLKLRDGVEPSEDEMTDLRTWLDDKRRYAEGIAGHRIKRRKKRHTKRRKKRSKKRRTKRSKKHRKKRRKTRRS